MPKKFNPFDPLGLFHASESAEKPIWALEPGEHGRLISKAEKAGLPRLPDPLGILERKPSNPGKGLQFPDPLGIFSKKSDR